jgi:biopolymer transport protein TolQ
MAATFNGSVWQLIRQSDSLSKSIYFILLVMSIICWTILFYKLLLLRHKQNQIRKASFLIKNTHNIDEVLHLSSKLADGLPGYFFVKSLNAFKSVLGVRHQNSQEKSLLSDRGWDFLQDKIDSIISSIIIKEESYLPFLAISAAVAPLLGLLGTVWGLIHSFMDISQKQAADIATVAPGLAEALLTTLAGLMVAIPATVMYYFLKGKVLKLEEDLYNMSDSFMNIVHQTEEKCAEENK